mmetsp:Transcript_13486/g.42351  ORF Transcript_13486/g.42351 Transcript_13486/m.42351 type:complete len:401 (+) Transcript_13486:1792-2994(+)
MTSRAPSPDSERPTCRPAPAWLMTFSSSLAISGLSASSPPNSVALTAAHCFSTLNDTVPLSWPYTGTVTITSAVPPKPTQLNVTVRRLALLPPSGLLSVLASAPGPTSLGTQTFSSKLTTSALPICTELACDRRKVSSEKVPGAMTAGPVAVLYAPETTERKARRAAVYSEKVQASVTLHFTSAALTVPAVMPSVSPAGRQPMQPSPSLRLGSRTAASTSPTGGACAVASWRARKASCTLPLRTTAASPLAVSATSSGRVGLLLASASASARLAAMSSWSGSHTLTTLNLISPVGGLSGMDTDTRVAPVLKQRNLRRISVRSGPMALTYSSMRAEATSVSSTKTMGPSTAIASVPGLTKAAKEKLLRPAPIMLRPGAASSIPCSEKAGRVKPFSTMARGS